MQYKCFCLERKNRRRNNQPSPSKNSTPSIKEQKEDSNSNKSTPNKDTHSSSSKDSINSITKDPTSPCNPHHIQHGSVTAVHSAHAHGVHQDESAEGGQGLEFFREDKKSVEKDNRQHRTTVLKIRRRRWLFICLIEKREYILNDYSLLYSSSFWEGKHQYQEGIGFSIFERCYLGIVRSISTSLIELLSQTVLDLTLTPFLKIGRPSLKSFSPFSILHSFSFLVRLSDCLSRFGAEKHVEDQWREALMFLGLLVRGRWWAEVFLVHVPALELHPFYKLIYILLFCIQELK